MPRLYSYLDYSGKLNKDQEPKLWNEIKLISNQTERELDKKGESIVEPTLDTEFSKQVVVFGLPIAPKKKTDTMKKIFTKKLLPKAEIKEGFIDIEFEFDESDSKTTGVAVMEFDNKQIAAKAAKNLNKVKFGKNVLKMMLMEEYEELFKENEQEESNFKKKEELAEWRSELDKKVLWTKVSPIYADTMMLDAVRQESKPLLNIRAKDKFTGALWSDSGDYLILFEERGFRVFGGEKLEPITFFYHKNVRAVLFDPNEKYVASYNGSMAQNDNKTDENLIIWDFFSGDRLRSFKVENHMLASSFHFDGRGKFFCRLQRLEEQNALIVYELPTMFMTKDPKTDKRCQIDVFNPIACRWSPKDSHLAVLCGALTNDSSATNPSEIRILSMPSRKVYKWISLNVGVVSGHLNWASSGEFLVSHLTHKKKKRYLDLVQVGRINFMTGRSNVNSLEYIEEKKKETARLVLSPSGMRGVLFISSPELKSFHRIVVFAIVASERGGFYHCELETIEKTKFKMCAWGPLSERLVIGDGNTALFFEVTNDKKKKKLKCTAIKSVQTENYTRITFSPCGRFICFINETKPLSDRDESSSTLAMKFYTAYGDFIKMETDKDMRVFSWRKVKLLNLDSKKNQKAFKEDKKEVIKNFDDLDAEDLKEVDKMKYEKITLQKKQAAVFESILKERREFWGKMRKTRVKEMGFDEDEAIEEDQTLVVEIQDKLEVILKTEIEAKKEKEDN